MSHIVQSLNGHVYKMDTSVKWTRRLGPLPFFASFSKLSKRRTSPYEDDPSLNEKSWHIEMTSPTARISLSAYSHILIVWPFSKAWPNMQTHRIKSETRVGCFSLATDWVTCGQSFTRRQLPLLPKCNMAVIAKVYLVLYNVILTLG